MRNLPYDKQNGGDVFNFYTYDFGRLAIGGMSE